MDLHSNCICLNSQVTISAEYNNMDANNYKRDARITISTPQDSMTISSSAEYNKDKTGNFMIENIWNGKTSKMSGKLETSRAELTVDSPYAGQVRLFSLLVPHPFVVAAPNRCVFVWCLRSLLHPHGMLPPSLLPSTPHTNRLRSLEPPSPCQPVTMPNTSLLDT